MKLTRKFLAAALLCTSAISLSAQTAVPSTFKHITIDGSFADWNGVPLAYTADIGPANAIQYENVYIANDQTNLYVRFTLYSPRPTAFANSYDNIFVDADDNSSTGFAVGGIGSEMLIQFGSGYQEKGGAFNEGAINNLGWNIAGSSDSTDFELVISLGATYASDSTPVFSSSTIALLLEGDNTSYANTAFAPTTGGFVYTLATPPAPLTTDLPLVTTAASSWEVNDSGTDLGTNWLDQAYDDTVSGWKTGDGLFGYTTSPASYPAIQTPLATGENTYYFRTHFQWINDSANVAFVVTNYLSDGAVYYLNGLEARRIRMPSGAVTFATAATSTNSPVGQPDVFGLDGSFLQYGDNILEVETHQAPTDTANMVFGLSYTASVDYPVFVVNTNLPASQSAFAGQPVTFTSDVIGSGPLSYQWFLNGTNAIAGANAATYTIPSVLTNNVGGYSLQVSNLFSTVTTPVALLTVSNTPVSITSQPTDQVAVQGQPATFTITVSGTPVIQYQWAVGGVAIPGATNATYTIPATALTNSGIYQVSVSNPASTTNSVSVNLSVLKDTIPPSINSISANSTQIIVTFAKPLDPATAGTAANYTVNGVTITAATPNSANANQVILTTGTTLNFGTVYTLTVHGVNDLFGNTAQVTGQFARDISIDGSFADWTGIAPIYTSTAPSGNVNAADFEDIYVYDDANYYYFYVILWADIDPSAGQFPDYVNMFFDTDNNAATGYAAFGSDMLVQSGYSYQEKDGAFNDGFGINGLNWLCLPAAPGTNFEFRIAKAATFGEDGTPVFTTNLINFIFQGMNPSFAVQNTVPASGVFSYNNATPVAVASLPLGSLTISALPSGQAAVVWDSPGTLQVASSLLGGTWTNLPSATSPYIAPASGSLQFFRLSQ